MNNLTIDFTNWEQLIDLMNHADDYHCSLFGSTEKGEMIVTSICNDFILVETHQENGWLRKMYYERDFTIEELYEREEDEDVEETIDESISLYDNEKLKLFAKFCKLKGVNVDNLLNEYFAL